MRGKIGSRLGLIVVLLSGAIGLTLPLVTTDVALSQSYMKDQQKAVDEFSAALKSGSEDHLGNLATPDFGKGLIEVVKAKGILGTTSIWTRRASVSPYPATSTFDLVAKSNAGAEVPFRITLKYLSRDSGCRISAVDFNVKE